MSELISPVREILRIFTKREELPHIDQNGGRIEWDFVAFPSPDQPDGHGIALGRVISDLDEGGFPDDTE